MSQALWVRSHVEQLLEQEWDLCRVQADGDGDYPFRRGPAMCWVSVLETEPPMVRVFAHAALGVGRSAKLLRELNEIQHRALSARVELVHDLVLVSQTVSAYGLTGPVLAQAMEEVAATASHVGPLLVAMFGGTTPFESDVAASVDDAGAEPET
jgi:hypothetical protein